MRTHTVQFVKNQTIARRRLFDAPLTTRLGGAGLSLRQAFAEVQQQATIRLVTERLAMRRFARACARQAEQQGDFVTGACIDGLLDATFPADLAAGQ
jgi:hypothetical protein